MCPSTFYRLSLPVIFAWCGCNKTAFLNTPPSSTLSIPANIDDGQALLDNDVVMNGFGNGGYPYLGLMGSDDLYATEAQYSTYTPTEQQAYIWAPQINTVGGLTDWSFGYRTVTTANQVLTGLAAIHPTAAQRGSWDRTEGGALFFRAFAFYQLAQIFARDYDSSNAATDPGIPLRMTADIGETLHRATVRQTYDRIIADLDSAGRLLPSDSIWYPTRPARAAVYALLARVYLNTRDFQKSLRYSDSSLQLQGALMQYDTIRNTTLPFHRWNPEVIFSAVYTFSGPTALHRSYADSLLFQSYAPNDLRRLLFFKSDANGAYFFGRYDESGYGFCGLATDEMYLTRAECYARTGDAISAMTDLNKLLASRWAAGAYVSRTATDADDALQQVLTERRKELLFRGTRWTDLRRLNKDTLRAVTLHRRIGGMDYYLQPNSKLYVYPIPADVQAVNPLTPNPR
jgi:hypothetical protein